MFYLVKAPWILKKMYGEAAWKLPSSEKILYLTFDDGPDPQATSFVLEQLKRFNAKATFFCIGNNVHHHFETYKQVISAGHIPGNHTYNHLNGWKTKDSDYLEDVELAANIIDSHLFRPPYGKITRFKMKALAGERFRLKTVMWDVISGDFDESLSPEKCYSNVVKNAGKGSIVVFHDSAKAFPRLKYALPKVLEFYSERGYQFKSLNGIL
jgi:peptidoglycan-N-acetylglucosamine deacetylase